MQKRLRAYEEAIWCATATIDPVNDCKMYSKGNHDDTSEMTMNWAAYLDIEKATPSCKCSKPNVQVFGYVAAMPLKAVHSDVIIVMRLLCAICSAGIYSMVLFCCRYR